MGIYALRGYLDASKGSISCQTSTVRCPGHTIHFLRYDYSKYTSKILELLDIDPKKIDFSKYENYHPYED
jgi:hypothetical protein